ncbi:MAG: GGDEF domain-containing protein [Gammaproteobacteria bacterium]|nr:GGDEF domain-containing protein [Gammaproteobacteria bacterium]
MRRTLGEISTDLRGIIVPWFYSPLVLSHRAELLIGRVRLIAALFALLTPLWCIVDRLFMPQAVMWPLCGARILAALAFAMLAISYRKSDHTAHAYVALGSLFLIPTLFFAFASVLLGDLEGEGIAISLISGYHLLPFLIAAGLSVFPLTAIEGVIFAIPVVAVQWVSTVVLGDANATEELGLIWLIVLIAAVAVLSGMTQLHYLSEIVTKSAHDPLTNAYNRLTGEEFMEKYLSLARRNKTPFSLVFVDIDHFKSINDSYGHEAGDAMLEQVGKALASQLRKEDSLIRWGGEEFILALPMSNLDESAEMISRLGAHGLGLRPDGTALTASVGVACNIADNIDELQALIQCADERMYQAKEGGRNRYCDGTKNEPEKMTPFIRIGA